MICALVTCNIAWLCVVDRAVGQQFYIQLYLVNNVIGTKIAVFCTLRKGCELQWRCVQFGHMRERATTTTPLPPTGEKTFCFSVIFTFCIQNVILTFFMSK